jgi:hypothetical protein
MKQITIQGKHQKTKLEKATSITNESCDPTLRECMKTIEEHYFDPKIQKTLINRLYLEESIPYKHEILKELDKKLSSYSNQDLHKKKYTNHETTITRDEIIEKLVLSRLKCFYCKCDMVFLYNKVRSMDQWTLDRIDNTLNHCATNVIISCLKCNLQKRCQNHDKFLFTKRLTIHKV